jgi:hypothetical protein
MKLDNGGQIKPFNAKGKTACFSFFSLHQIRKKEDFQTDSKILKSYGFMLFNFVDWKMISFEILKA